MSGMWRSFAIHGIISVVTHISLRVYVCVCLGGAQLKDPARMFGQMASSPTMPFTATDLLSAFTEQWTAHAYAVPTLCEWFGGNWDDL